MRINWSSVFSWLLLALPPGGLVGGRVGGECVGWWAGGWVAVLACCTACYTVELLLGLRLGSIFLATFMFLVDVSKH